MDFFFDAFAQRSRYKRADKKRGAKAPRLVILEKEKARTLGWFAPSVMTVAGGFGGSGDDQSSLIKSGQRHRCEEGQRGGEAEKLGHLLAPLLALRFV